MDDIWTMTVRIYGEAEIDVAEISKAALILLHPVEPHEIRGIGPARSRLVRSSDLTGLIKAVQDIGGGIGTYFTLNPVVASLGDHAAKVGDITRRYNLLVDCDPVKPVEGMASQAERDEALSLMGRVLDWLTAQGWPFPVIVDSGNGAHLVFRIDLPSDEHTRVLIGRLLKALAERFNGTGAVIDTKVHNASRISKLPGTWVRKGENTPERPWRMARLLFCPDAIQIVTLDQIEAVAGVGETPPNGSVTDTWEMAVTHGPDRIANYVKSAIEREFSKVVLSPDGDRNNALNAAAFALGQFVGARLADRSEIEAALLIAAQRVGLAERESRLTIASGVAAGIAQPRVIPASVQGAGQNGVYKPGQIDTAKPLIIWGNTIKPRKVEWLWEGRIPKRKLTTFAGVGGLGKTFVLCDLAARISQGDEWPFSGGLCADKGKVLFISGEDDPDDTLVPRLLELGADLTQIAFLTTECLDRFTLADIPAMDAMAAQMGGSVAMVAIDPPTAYLGGVDDHKNSELRSLLSPLAAWTARQGCSTIFNTHVNKQQGAKVEAMMRVMGSVAWVNAVRAAYMIAKDPNDPARRLFIGMKNNLGKERKGLAYQITETEKLAKVEWLGEVDTTADEAMAQEKKQIGKRVEDGVKFLLARYSEANEWNRDDLFTMAAKEGVSKNAVYEAKQELKVKAGWVGRTMIWKATPETMAEVRKLGK